MEAALLGETVYSETLTAQQAGLTVTGTLSNTRMLSGVSSITVGMAKPLDLLGGATPEINWNADKGKNNNKSKWQISGSHGPLKATFHVAADLHAEVTKLTAEALLTFNVVNGGLSLNRKASWVQLDTAASSTITMKLGAVIGVAVPAPLDLFVGDSLDIFDARLKGTLTPKFEATLRVNLNNLTSFTADSRAGIQVGYNFQYYTEALPENKEPDTKLFTTFTEGTIGSFALFGLKLPGGMLPPAP